jgi:hypothetical protein
MLGAILLIFIVLVLLGGVAPWGRNPNGPYPNPGHFYGGGSYLGGGLGLVLVIVLILVLLGRF